MATPNMVTFSDWQQKTNAGLMSAAEELLEKLEDTSDLLSEIDEKYIRSEKDSMVAEGRGGGPGKDQDDDHKCSIIQRFHAGLDSARNLVNVLKREKWRLSKREMSVELRMGELEDYKTHLKKDMSSLNQTVEALSLRVVQLENQLVEAQEIQENLEAELQEHKNSLQDANDRNIKLYTENEDLKKKTAIAQQTSQKPTLLQKENQMLKDEVTVLSLENSKLKDMVRHAEAMASPVLLRKEGFGTPKTPNSPKTPTKEAPLTPTFEKKKDDNLSRLTQEFLEELTSLELRENGKSGGGSGETKESFTKRVSGADV